MAGINEIQEAIQEIIDEVDAISYDTKDKVRAVLFLLVNKTLKEAISWLNLLKEKEKDE